MADPFRIRKAVPGDLSAVVAIERRCFNDPWSAASFRSIMRGTGLVATWDERVVGYLFARRIDREAEIVNFAVDPDRRRAGIGRALIDEVISRLEASGVQSIFLEVRASNSGARHLYAERGFAEVGKRERYYRRPVEDAVVMARNTGRFGGLRK